ncbi:hypothetical protein Tco_0566920 [Tanacetum coccineum]
MLPQLSGLATTEFPNSDSAKILLSSANLSRIDQIPTEVVKERTTATAITEGTWGLTLQAWLRDEIIPRVSELEMSCVQEKDFVDNELMINFAKEQGLVHRALKRVKEYIKEKPFLDTRSSVTPLLTLSLEVIAPIPDAKSALGTCCIKLVHLPHTTVDLDAPSPTDGFVDLDNQTHAITKLRKLFKDETSSTWRVDTPMVEKSKLDEDKEGKAVDPSHYRGMIGTLLYLTASRPDLQFAICMCARYQARPTEKHLNAVKRIFRYLKGTVHRGLWYPKDSSFALTAFADMRIMLASRHRFHFIKELLRMSDRTYFVPIRNINWLDIFTKALGIEKELNFLQQVGNGVLADTETIGQDEVMNSGEDYRLMALSIADQIALDDALVAPADRLKIGKCNLRLSSDITSKEATLQVVYDVLKLTPFYKAFQVTADAPEIYMQEFWASAYVHNRSVRFKMNNKKHIIGLEQFRDILQICPKVGNKKFVDPPLEKEILIFLSELALDTLEI